MNDSICLYFLFDAYIILGCDCESKINKNKKKSKRIRKTYVKSKKLNLYLWGNF